jgi:hypothetical protein
MFALSSFFSKSHAPLPTLPMAIAVAVFGLSPGAGSANSGFAPLHGAGKSAACKMTADLMAKSCAHEIHGDALAERAKCLNLSEAEERSECYAEVSAEREVGAKLCAGQEKARLDACKLVGPGRYDPDFDAEDFDSDFANLTRPNPYFPLAIGNRWEYQAEDETDTLEVVAETKQIDELTCIVVRDLVSDRQHGLQLEQTDDWYCQAKNGDVMYLGEEVKNYESFDGDNPRVAELVTVDGSFKEGRNRDRGGMIFPAKPRAGMAYYEEFSLGNAEDLALILSTTYRYGVNADLDRFVPRALAEHLCAAGDCVVTRNASQLEPGVVGRKYYARGIGVFAETDPAKGLKQQIVNCNFDARCTSLPTP